MFESLPFTGLDLLKSLIIIIIFLAAGKLITFISQTYLKKWAAKSKTTLDDVIIEKIRPPFSYIIWFLGLRAALNPLKLDFESLDRILNTIILLIAIYAISVFTNVFVIGVLEKLTSKTESKLDDALMPLVSKTINVIIYLVGLMWVLSIWSIDIAPLLASLGIAGLALGFAVKDSLANIFGGISMILDQTIKVGDRVKLESGEAGYIVDMGLRSSRLKTANNELIIIPNGQLANSRIKNYNQPDPVLRVVIDFGVSYDSEIDKVRKVIHDVLQTIDNLMDDPAPDVIFVSMGDFTLNFQARFWVTDQSQAWNKKLEATNKIFAVLKENKIDIPYPTQTIYLQK